MIKTYPAAVLIVAALLAGGCAATTPASTQNSTSAALTTTTVDRRPETSRPTSSRTPPSAQRGVKPAIATTKSAVSATFTTPDGRRRTYGVYVPSVSPTNEPMALLVALHGGTGTAKQYEVQSGYDGLAESNGFVVVYPDGIEIGGSSILSKGEVWNGGNCCGAAVTQKVDDVRFVSMVIDEMMSRYRIDPARIFATGHSNGAIMSYRLACELADKIVAIGIQAGSLEVPACAPAKSVSLVHIHGTADKNLPIDGGKGQGLSDVAFQPPINGVEAIAFIDGCPKEPTTVTSKDNADVTTQTWQPCRAGTEVEFIKVTGASHAWMGHPGMPAGETLTGPPYMQFDSSQAIWAFLAAHPRTS